MKSAFSFRILLTLCLTALLTPALRADEKHAADNTPPEGFTALFNGKDLTGWKGLMASPNDNPYNRAKLSDDERAKAQAEADEDMRKHWSAKDGVIVFDGKGRSLATAKDYGDFEMYVDWKIEKTGDSGIYVRGTPQIQIWDTEFKDYWKLGADKGSGGLWNNAKHPRDPSAKADNPTGEWNTFWIKMVGDKVWVKLNGELVVDGVPLENEYFAGQAKMPGAGVPETGQIELQNHTSPLYFKNIYIKELPAAADTSK
jgi:hypothetical protein